MSTDPLTLILAVLAFILTVLWRITKRGPRLPPGPPSYPLVGSLLSIDFADFVGEMSKMRKLYGNVFSIMISYKVSIIQILDCMYFEPACSGPCSAFISQTSLGKLEKMIKLFGDVIRAKSRKYREIFKVKKWRKVWRRWFQHLEHKQG